MTQKPLSATGSHVPANDPLSVIARVRQGRRARPAHAGAAAQHAYLPANTDSAATRAVAVQASASTMHSTGNPLMDHLLARVGSYPNDRLIKEPAVLTIIGRSKAAMRRDVLLGLFPRQVKTGLKSSAWRESEVMGWVEATTILSRVDKPGFGMKDFVAALSCPINVSTRVSA
ncbi:helix-turn-helix transcriptional regulator [Paraburkholderia caribensis]|uniref:helix-turn-helix transcriptional regulator n=1 Tax=Paraburkholderia caribensis TaxID=75105 RepID=UPI00078E063F|nr:AlpA family phage regulatory protein [Paraburkholderia caribensis]AMV41769.1 hypothetical protein ATN79_03600 [Paraburkholderia caribensis]